MAKKKNLKGSVDELEMEFINEKMRGDSAHNYLTTMGLTTKLKTLNYKLDIKCKTEKQKEFLNQLKDESKKICFGIGSPGTGKSFLSLSYALKAIKDGLYSNIVMIIPTAQAGGADLSLGFLKGDFEQKTTPFLEADKETVSKILKLSGNIAYNEISSLLVSSGIIKHEYVNFLLGKTIDDSIILVNEAEQFTKSNMRLILTRLGENSKIIISGDFRQVNRRSIKNKNEVCGLNYAVDKLGTMEEASVTEFGDEDIVRNSLITKILQRFDDEE
jgi:phosphate starvation-inducible PhoH-like protein